MGRFLLGVRSVNFGTIMDIISKVLKEMRYLPAYLMTSGGGDDDV